MKFLFIPERNRVNFSRKRDLFFFLHRFPNQTFIHMKRNKFVNKHREKYLKKKIQKGW